jgi:hypothetical protein
LNEPILLPRTDLQDGTLCFLITHLYLMLCKREF